MKKFDQLIDIMKTLRDPDDGCPWDLKQDHRSLAKYAVEEAYEVMDAIERGTTDDLKEELGDLLLQVVFHAQVAADNNGFTIEDVLDAINTKMITRHPHVFDQTQNLSVEEVQKQWDEIKGQGNQKPMLANVPQSYPALMKAHAFGEKVGKVGFDWSKIEEVKAKMDEEWLELAQAIAADSPREIEEELGDFLFATAQYARKLGYHPEMVLQKANAKFAKRFQVLEELVAGDGKTLAACTTHEFEEYWQRVKKIR